MKTFIRGIILIAILVLIAAAYLSWESGRPSSPGGLRDSIPPSFSSLMDSLGEKIPALKKDLDRLGEDIKKRVGEVELGPALSRLTELQKRLKAAAPMDKVSWDVVSSAFQSVIQRLKELKAEDLVIRVEALYSELKKKWEEGLAKRGDDNP